MIYNDICNRTTIAATRTWTKDEYCEFLLHVPGKNSVRFVFDMIIIAAIYAPVDEDKWLDWRHIILPSGRYMMHINTLRPRANGCHFGNDIFKCIFFNENVFCLIFPWSLSLKFQLTIPQHWFRKWLGTNQATSHYLNHWWLDYRRIHTSPSLNQLSRRDHIDISCWDG